MWVADMDFAIPEAITIALQSRANHPILGYSIAPDSLYEALIDWLLAKHQWQVKREWIVLTPGVVPSLNLVVAALTEENSGVIVQPPVYFPFYSAVTNQNRRLIENPTRGIPLSDFLKGFAAIARCQQQSARFVLQSKYESHFRICPIHRAPVDMAGLTV